MCVRVCVAVLGATPWPFSIKRKSKFFDAAWRVCTVCSRVRHGGLDTVRLALLLGLLAVGALISDAVHTHLRGRAFAVFFGNMFSAFFPRCIFLVVIVVHSPLP